jgi:predicted SAM-dependent methyltransferase
MHLFKRSPRPAEAPQAVPGFSLRELARANAGLAAYYLWGVNAAPPAAAPMYLHLGCGERVLGGFVNLDFIPHDERVHAWNLLDLWPEDWTRVADGVFAEDTLEHFFHGEQAYILCNANRALRDGGVARMLMPSLARLVEYSASYKPAPDEFLHQVFGVETGADALNMGMRFSGHRWLHSAESLARLAATCGFDTVPTTCAESTVPAFNGVNLRSESDSLSFAHDLRKARPVGRTLLAPRDVTGARHVEAVAPGIDLFVSTAARPTVRYELPAALPVDRFACLNIRASNLSSFLEHNQKRLVIDGVRADNPWHFDETMKSRPCMNLVTRNELPLLVRGASEISRMVFSPAATEGEYFALGCAEVFAFE